MRVTLTSLAAVLVLCSTVMSVGVPNVINYQGRLIDSAGVPVADGQYLIKFIIYDAAKNGTMLWNSGPQSVTLMGGLFSYELGSKVTLSDLFGTDSIRYLGISVGSDPELIPRKRFRSSGYVFKSLKSEHSSDAETINGLQPSYYLDWGNMSNIPAGFSDGVDNQGIDQSAADNRYLLESGGSLGRDLAFDGDNDGIFGGRIDVLADAANFELHTAGQIKAKLWGEQFGELVLRDSSGNLTARMSATNASGGFVRLNTNTGVGKIQLNGGISGDGSVVLPNNAINSLETVDEPGFAFNIGTDPVTMPEMVGMVDIVSVDITTPADGWILLEGHCTAVLSDTTTAAVLYFQMDSQQGGTRSPIHSVIIGEVDHFNTGVRYFPVHVTKHIAIGPGTTQFRLEGSNEFSSGKVQAVNGTIMVTYFPTEYGSVLTATENPGDHPEATRFSFSTQDGSTQSAYKIDLRYYEEKALAARLARQKAELEKLDAQFELEQARANQTK